MKVYELETKNGRVFRVNVANRAQENRLHRVISNNNKTRNYEIFGRIDVIVNGVHDIKGFEQIAATLV